MSVYLRKFTKSDSNHVVSWFSTEQESLYWGGWMFGWPLSTTEMLKRNHLPEVEFFTLTDGKDCIGFIELQHMSITEIRLYRVAVSPGYRGQGLGRELITLSLTEIRDREQFKIATLAVFSENLTAYNCYKSLGFVAVDKEPKFREFHGQKWPLVQMETAL
ncbi:GNAT family N-acetyltransferase [Vibrio parahaemolyticus]